jgi:hypothetical protein
MVKKNTKPAKASAQAEKNGFSLISNETLKALYADLLKCQRVVKNGAFFDALPTGVLMGLHDGDAVVSTSADAAVRVKRKGKPAAGVSASLDAFLGAGLLAKASKSGKVGVVFGETEADGWQDAVEAARVHGLPLIFVSRAHEVNEREAARTIRREAKKRKPVKSEPAVGYLPRIHVDANDVVAVYRVAHEAIDRARRGRGATWIEGVPFKLEGKKRGPDAVAGMEQYLRGKGLLR